MIEVIYDQFRLEKATGNDLEIEEPAHYEPCLQKIRLCADSKQEIRIFVRNPGMYGWFDSVNRKYGGVLRVKDPLIELALLMNNAPLPAFLKNNPELVVRLRLIEKFIASPKKEGESLDNWMLRVLLGPAWSNEHLTADEQIIAIMDWFTDESKSSSHPAILRFAQDRLEYWIEGSPKASQLLQWLLPEPFKRCHYLAWEQMLSTYPKNRIAEWLQYQGVWAVLSQFPEREHFVPRWAISPTVQLPPPITNSIRAFLKDEWEKRSPAAALSYISGSLEVEISFIVERLRMQLRQGQAIEKSLYESLAAVTNVNTEVMELAEALLPVSPPSPLDEQADLQEVRNWLTEGYLPFYDSCALLKNLDSTAEPTQLFVNWFKKHYPTLLVSGQGMAYRKIHSLKERLRDNPLMLLVVDGLDYLTAQNQLMPALIAKGLYPEEEMTPYFTFLPSETPIAKPALLRGKMPSQIPEEKPNAAYYSDLVQQVFDLAPHEIRAATNKDMNLEELVNEQAKVYLYLDNRLDGEFLHAQFSPAVRRKKYKQHVNQLVEALADAISTHEELFGQEPLLVIATDHGYTEIPDCSKVIPTLSKTKNRSAVASNVSPENHEVWLLAPEDVFGLQQKMVIPHGYGCFGSKPKGATHGGCSPQEVAVPWILLTKSKPVPLEPLLFYIQGAIHRRRKENPLTLCISNPNRHSVRIIQIQMQGITFDGLLSLDVASESVRKIHCQFNAEHVAGNFVEILGNYTMQRMGEKRTEQIKLTIETAGAMSNEFDDDFDV